MTSASRNRFLHSDQRRLSVRLDDHVSVASGIDDFGHSSDNGFVAEALVPHQERKDCSCPTVTSYQQTPLDALLFQSVCLVLMGDFVGLTFVAICGVPNLRVAQKYVRQPSARSSMVLSLSSRDLVRTQTEHPDLWGNCVLLCLSRSPGVGSEGLTGSFVGAHSLPMS